MEVIPRRFFFLLCPDSFLVCLFVCLLLLVRSRIPFSFSPLSLRDRRRMATRRLRACFVLFFFCFHISLLPFLGATNCFVDQRMAPTAITVFHDDHPRARASPPLLHWSSSTFDYIFLSTSKTRYNFILIEPNLSLDQPDPTSQKPILA